MLGTKLTLSVIEEQGNNWTPEFAEKPLIERWQAYLESLFMGEEVYSIKVIDVFEEEVDEPIPVEVEEGEIVDEPMDT